MRNRRIAESQNRFMMLMLDILKKLKS